MFLSDAEIWNYRTFRHVTLSFDAHVNYMVGDSRIGKSNFLALLDTIFAGRGFPEKDFLDASEPIRVILTFSSANGVKKARVLVSQDVRQVAVRLSYADTGEVLPPEEIRRVLFVPYSMEHAMRRDQTPEYLSLLGDCFREALSGDPEELSDWERLFANFGISVKLTDAADAAAFRFLQAVYEPNEETGPGMGDVQTMMAAAAFLLTEIYRRKKSRAVPFSDMVITHPDGKRVLPLLVGIDEPELRLHPFRQRSVLSFLHKLLHNEEPVFLRLLQKVLGVDGLSGQIFVVTHSTDALVNDYRKIIRLYWAGDQKVAAACGVRFRFGAEIEKHLIMHFPEVKEALFGRAALLVEGETEYGSFPYFAQAMGESFDFHGISLINARGETSIARIAELLKRFHVPVISLYDRDVSEGRRGKADVFFTDYICYEMDVARHLLPARRKTLDAAIREAADGETYVSGSLVKKAAGKLDVSRKDFPPRNLSAVPAGDTEALCFYYFAWLYGNKGVITGRALGMTLTESEIPPVFKKVIRAAVEASKRR